jgi:hypothetical protein
MAPSVYHRLRWGRGGKSDVIWVAHRFFLGGSACLGAGIITAVFLVGDVLFGRVAGIVAGCAVASTVALTWYAMPAMRSRRPAVRDRQ